ncbi:uncharacterized protein LOC143026882 [Oratosquilla oratoria]|uniref:uncharacterized protein LOC143026882 n=1 Tax=Oratosquilla oratoria TaxID=337810 RepID=UPI003F7737C7
MLTAEKRIRTKEAAEDIVKRRHGILRELIDEFSVKVSVAQVPSGVNKADALTRVKKSWLRVPEEEARFKVCAAGSLYAKELHRTYHLGADRSLFLARKADPNITRGEVRRVVRAYVRFQSIDPAPRPHATGELNVEENWRRLAVDVEHYRRGRYLSMVDCGLGRFAVWQELKTETGEEIARVVNEIFLERGPVDEVLMDNSTAFRSRALKEMLDKWSTKRFFRAAYQPSGNGIIERQHRTIKSIAERALTPPVEAVFWYNMSPRSSQDEYSVPQKALFEYEWRHLR